MLASLGLVLAQFVPQGGAVPYVDFGAELRKTTCVLVVGTLGKVVEGKKDRLKAGEGNLDEGGISTSISGTVFAKVQATARVAVVKALHGTSEPAVTIAFDMQTAKLGDGSQRRHFLLTPRVPLEDSMLALFFLEKAKDKLLVTRVIRYDAKKNVTPETFRGMCEDLYAVNVRIRDLRDACDTATQLRATDRNGARDVLQKALGKPLVLREAQSETWRKTELAPHEQKAKELLESVGGSDGPPPAPSSAPTKASR